MQAKNTHTTTIIVLVIWTCRRCRRSFVVLPSIATETVEGADTEANEGADTETDEGVDAGTDEGVDTETDEGVDNKTDERAADEVDSGTLVMVKEEAVD